MIVDHIGNWRRYGFGPAWKETMRWLENYAPGGSGSLADLTDGTHPLTDGFVSVATLTSRPLSGSLYECHKRSAMCRWWWKARNGCSTPPQRASPSTAHLMTSGTWAFSSPLRRKSAGLRFRPAPLPCSSRGTRIFRPSRWTEYRPPCASAWAKFPSSRCAFHKTTCNANDFRANLRPSRGKVWPVLRDSPCFTLK